MEKPYTKFANDLISFHKVLNLQSFEFGNSDAVPMNVQFISPLVFFAYFG